MDRFSKFVLIRKEMKQIKRYMKLNKNKALKGHVLKMKDDDDDNYEEQEGLNIKHNFPIKKLIHRKMLVKGRNTVDKNVFKKTKSAHIKHLMGWYRKREVTVDRNQEKKCSIL